jgi:hypothetical protein
MRIALVTSMALLLAVLSGCETIKESEGANKSEFIYVNARNVPEEMEVTLRKNGALLETKTIAYVGDASREVFWDEGDELQLVYNQDQPELTQIVPLYEGKIVYTAVGNADNNNSPILFNGPDESELAFSFARIRVLNAMPGDVRKVVINNNEETELLGYPSLSDPLDADVEINGIANVEIQDVNDTVIRSFALDMENHAAYLMVIYEERTVPVTPNIKLLDITP